MFSQAKKKNILDIDRAESVFALFFLFVRDPACGSEEQIKLDEILSDIFLGHSLPGGSKKRLACLYERIMISPPPFNNSVDQLIQDIGNDKEALVAYVKILFRIISEDGMISKRHGEDLKYFLNKCKFTSMDLEEFSEEEQAIMSFAASGANSSGYKSHEIEELYIALECKPDSTIDEVKKAYRILAMKYHPDRAHLNQSSSRKNAQVKKFQQIQMAYSKLLSLFE